MGQIETVRPGGDSTAHPALAMDEVEPSMVTRDYTNGRAGLSPMPEFHSNHGAPHPLLALLKAWRLMLTGATAVIMVLIGLWQMGVFAYDKRIAILESNSEQTNQILGEIKGSISDLGRRMDARLERVDANMLNLVAGGKLTPAPQVAAPAPDQPPPSFAVAKRSAEISGATPRKPPSPPKKTKKEAALPKLKFFWQ